MKTERLSSQQARIRQLDRDAVSSPYRVRAVVDIRGRFDAERLTAALRHSGADAALQAALQSAIERVSATRARWTLTAPALLADEPTLRRIIEGSVAAYRRAGDDDGDAGVAETVAYADYVDWQEALACDPDAAAARAYWTERACPDASRFRLPCAREARDVQAFTPAVVTRTIDGRLAGDLRRSAAAARVDLATWLLAAFQALLWRHLESASIQVGVRLDGRGQPQLRGVLGPCARYAPVDIEVAARSTLADIARRTAAVVREHRVWQDCFAWDALDRRALPAEAIGYHAFAFDWRSARSATVGGSRAPRTPVFRIVDVAGTLDRFDVRLIATRAGRTVDCAFEWNRDQYDEDDVAPLADRYVELLADVAGRPGTSVADLEIVAAAERDQLLVHGRGAADVAPADGAIHELFEEQVARDGTRTAVIGGGSRLTYAELHGRAIGLAARLHRAGVSAGDRVAICLPRTVDQLVAMFGILELGAAFVPLDPSVPWERLAWTVADAKTSILIAPPEAVARVPPDAPVTLIAPAARAAVDDATPGFAARRVDPAAAAYVIYTSGSTGRPKGVVVSHRSVVHSTDARRTHYQRPAGTFLLVSPLSFDSAMAGIFWTMTTGGTLVIPADEEHNDPAALRRLIEQHGVTHTLCLPSLYGWVLDAEHLDALRSLQVVIVAGERCPAALVERHRRALPSVELHNEYGPTECSVWSTVYRAGTTADEASVPIGRPIARAQAYVAERPWRLAPNGAAGEALIGGAGVADGYLGRPDLTAERFVPDAWSGRPGARVYRTGDRVRWTAHGELDFLGRVDHQVKIRGYRIELEEIEAAIGAHADVRECAVAVRGAAGGERLVAYVVPDASAADSQAALSNRIRPFLGERLPPYMMPGAIVAIDALPKTPNGKVDRARLPEPATGAGPVANPPVSDTEKAIAALWHQELGREDVGVHDNFFDIGGHSLMAIAIFARLRAARAPQLKLLDLFEYPTIHTLAAFIDAAPAEAASAGAEPPADTEDADAAVVASARARQQALRRKRLEARAS